MIVYLIAKRPYEAFQPGPARQRAKWVFYLLLLYGVIAIPVLIVWYVPRNPVYNLFLGGVFTVLITNLILFFYFIIADVVALLRKATRYVATGASPSLVNHSRRRFVRQVGLGLAALPFFSFLHGITRGRYDFTVRRVQLKFPDLPPAFEGFRFTQISDVHSGSFDDIEKVKAGIALIQEQAPDLMLFTGDFVNERAEEADPFLPFWNQLSAPHGKFAVLGNHDYGFGRTFKDKADLEQNHLLVQEKYADAGFRLLKNESVKIEKNGQSIRLIGVENWGNPPFPQKGDLTKATEGVAEDEFKILMSHDPTHWDVHVLPFPQLIHLTLSGHTHGMQMGIDIPWLKMSLVRFVYPRWIDLYREGSRYLYVNRGFGWLGMPARVGIFPEITLFELTKG